MSIQCADCGFAFENEESGKPCPKCGSLNRQLQSSDEGKGHEQAKEKRYDSSNKHRHGSYYELHKGEDYSTKEGDWVEKEVVFDRDHDYTEKTIINKDGKIIYHKKEKLSEKKGKPSTHRERQFLALQQVLGGGEFATNPLVNSGCHIQGSA